MFVVKYRCKYETTKRENRRASRNLTRWCGKHRDLSVGQSYGNDVAWHNEIVTELRNSIGC